MYPQFWRNEMNEISREGQPRKQPDAGVDPQVRLVRFLMRAGIGFFLGTILTRLILLFLFSESDIELFLIRKFHRETPDPETVLKFGAICGGLVFALLFGLWGAVPLRRGKMTCLIGVLAGTFLGFFELFFCFSWTVAFFKTESNIFLEVLILLFVVLAGPIFGVVLAHFWAKLAGENPTMKGIKDGSEHDGGEPEK